MNDILQLKGTFHQRPNESTQGYRNMPKNASSITSSKLQSLLVNLNGLIDYWKRQRIINGCLIDVYYIDVIAKSNRIKGLLSGRRKSVNNSVVGARFTRGIQRKHIITHYVSEEVITNTVNNIQICIKLLDEKFSGEITHESITNLPNIDWDHYGISKSMFINIIVDAHYVESFSIPDNSINIKNQSIISIYKTNTDLIDLMKQIGINLGQDKLISETTMLLYPDEITKLSEKAPYLIIIAEIPKPLGWG